MTTDYILFVHGVNTREVREKPTYADIQDIITHGTISLSI